MRRDARRRGAGESVGRAGWNDLRDSLPVEVFAIDCEDLAAFDKAGVRAGPVWVEACNNLRARRRSEHRGSPVCGDPSAPAATLAARLACDHLHAAGALVCKSRQRLLLLAAASGPRHAGGSATYSPRALVVMPTPIPIFSCGGSSWMKNDRLKSPFLVLLSLVISVGIAANSTFSSAALRPVLCAVSLPGWDLSEDGSPHLAFSPCETVQARTKAGPSVRRKKEPLSRKCPPA
jgi:hypothetical protein